MLLKLKRSLQILVMFVMLVVFATVVSAEDIYPDEDGVYTYTYQTQDPTTNFVVLVLKGEYDEGDEIEITDDAVIYYNVFASDNQGLLDISFSPIKYADATMFIMGGSLEEPKKLCNVLKGEVDDFADFTINVEKEEYTVNGENKVLVKFSFDAFDSFGSPSEFPGNYTASFVNYEGDRLHFSDSSDTIIVSQNAEAGVYTFEITCDGITKQASFEIKRAPSVIIDAEVVVCGEISIFHYFDCYHKASGTVSDPETLNIKVVTVDQYGDEMPAEYKFILSKLNENEIPLNPVEIGRGREIDYKHTDFPEIDKTSGYELEAVSVLDPDFKLTTFIYFTGETLYTGKELALYEKYVQILDYMERIEAGEIVESADGKDVSYKNSWVTETEMAYINEAYQRAHNALLEIDEGVFDTSKISDETSAVSDLVLEFKKALRVGLLAPIEEITFAESEIYVKLGTEIEPKLTVVPVKSTETVIYTSSDESIVSVSRTGKIKALAIGEVTITASNSDGTVSDTLRIKTYRNVTVLDYRKNSITLVAGQKYLPEIRIQPQDHTDNIKYSSSNKKIATVNENGEITAISDGKVNISAVARDGMTTKIAVTVSKPEFSCDIESFRTKPGNEFSLPLNFASSYGIAKLEIKVKYDTSVLNLKEVEEHGVLTGYAGTTLDDVIEEQPGDQEQDSELLSEETENQEEISSWIITDPEKSNSGKLATYKFETLENAEFGDYEIEFEIVAYTQDNQVITTSPDSLTTGIEVREKNTYTVSAVASPAEFGSVEGMGEYEYGKSVTLTAKPKSLYNLSKWTIDGETVSTSSKYTFTVTEDVDVVAEFVKKTPSSVGGGGATGPVGVPDKVLEKVAIVKADIPSGEVEYGSAVTLTCATEGAYIYYTLDGSTPSASDIPYIAPIVITKKETVITAIAVKSGMDRSTPTVYTYTVKERPLSIELKPNATKIKYLPGVSGSEIKPDDAMTRYDVIIALDKIFDILGGTSKDTNFSDVHEDNKAIVEKFVDAGIINGYPDNTFGGEKGITRAELVKILSIMLGLENAENTYDASRDVVLNDISGHWAENHIKLFVAKGYLVGYPDGSFKPDNIVSRAEAVTIFNRITGIKLIEGLSPIFTDLDKEHWGYDDMMNVVDLMKH